MLRLTQFWKDGAPALGVWTGEGVIDASAAAGTMLEAIQGGGALLERLAALEGPVLEEVRFAPVVTGGDKILCIGRNYKDHAEECGRELPGAPALFNKFRSSLAAHGQEIALPREYERYDYEGEMVAVIGRPCRNVPRERAMEYVFGITCGNDLTARDLQYARAGQWLMGKSLDSFAPVGPCVAVGLDPGDLGITTRVNGELRQNSRTSKLIFDLPYLIADLSRHFTLLPGDLLFTGTPEGVMQGYPEDKKQWLKPGDRVEVALEGVGTLVNTLA